MKNYCKYLILLLLLPVFSCEEKPEGQQIPVSKNEMKNSMETANRYLLNEEEEDIANYIKRHGLEMTSTGTGLRYQIVKQGSEKRIEKGEKVTLEYEVCSIAGDVFYVPAGDGFKARFGNAGGIDIWVNGELAPKVGANKTSKKDVSLNPDSLMKKAK